MSRGRCALLCVVGSFVCISCGDDDSANEGAAGASEIGGQATAGESGVSFGDAGFRDGGAAGSPATGGTTMTQAGSPALGGVGGEAASSCQGDAEIWATITAVAPACETVDDCCVVVSSCLAEAQIVGVKDFAAAEAAWPYCGDDCTDCIPPAVVVACENGRCVGTASHSGDEGVSHCGDSAALGDDTAQRFGCQ